jgi:two-component system KDP operon response regulator KdpE
MATQNLILVIEDEPPMRHALCTALQSRGYATLEAATGSDGLYQVSLRSPDLVLLDLGLPDVDGVKVTHILRRSRQVPIIVVSARDAENDRIAALDAGANDYVTKPVREGELMARVRAALRSHAALRGEGETFSNGRIRVDFTRQEVFVDGNAVALTQKEYRLLAALVRDPGRVITHAQLLREVWGARYVDNVQHLRVYIKQLREKLEDNPSDPQFLLTASGVGYRFKLID